MCAMILIPAWTQFGSYLLLEKCSQTAPSQVKHLKFYFQCQSRESFSKPRFSSNSFLVKHFIDNVEYTAAGFLVRMRYVLSFGFFLFSFFLALFKSVRFRYFQLSNFWPGLKKKVLKPVKVGFVKFYFLQNSN